MNLDEAIEQLGIIIKAVVNKPSASKLPAILSAMQQAKAALTTAGIMQNADGKYVAEYFIGNGEVMAMPLADWVNARRESAENIIKTQARLEAAERERDEWRSEAKNAGGQLLAILERIEVDGYTMRFTEQNCETMWNRVNTIAALTAHRAAKGGEENG